MLEIRARLPPLIWFIKGMNLIASPARGWRSLRPPPRLELKPGSSRGNGFVEQPAPTETLGDL
jgi:hypothetical protein